MKRLSLFLLMLCLVVTGVFSSVVFAEEKELSPNEEEGRNSNSLIQYYIDGAPAGSSGIGGTSTFNGPPGLYDAFVRLVRIWADSIWDGVVAVFGSSNPNNGSNGRNARGCIQYYPYSAWVCPI